VPPKNKDGYWINPGVGGSWYKVANEKFFQKLPETWRDSSFRGSMYNEEVLQIAGQTLYTPYITSEIVKSMTWKLVETALDCYRDETCTHDHDQLDTLTRWFLVCAINGFGLAGWW
jgi:hypothetical protein